MGEYKDTYRNWSREVIEAINRRSGVAALYDDTQLPDPCPSCGGELDNWICDSDRHCSAAECVLRCPTCGPAARDDLKEEFDG